MKNTEDQSRALLPGMVGPCPDVEQRIKDLYIVNTVAGWAQNQLRILGDMAADHKLPAWYVSEVRRIQSKIETVAQRDDARRLNAEVSGLDVLEHANAAGATGAITQSDNMPADSQPPSDPQARSAKCSATAESANAWAEVGRDCMKKAMEAIAESRFGTADQYRKAADEAFSKELRLRESPNDGPHRPGSPDGSLATETRKPGSLK